MAAMGECILMSTRGMRKGFSKEVLLRLILEKVGVCHMHNSGGAFSGVTNIIQMVQTK